MGLRCGGGEGDPREVRDGRSVGVGSMSESNGFGGSTCAFGREVGSRGSGSLLATWSLKCCQSVVDPLVSHVPRSSSIRWPSLSEHMRR